MFEPVIPSVSIYHVKQNQSKALPQTNNEMEPTHRKTERLWASRPFQRVQPKKMRNLENKALFSVGQNSQYRK